MSEAGICVVVEPSITIKASVSPIVIEEVDFAEPSNKFNSAVVQLRPSNKFNSVAVEVTNVPPNFKPPAAPSWVEISTSILPSLPIPLISIPFVSVPSFSAT